MPPELFRQKEFNGFVASISKLNEDAVAAAYDKLFQSIVKEDFKRWHFMHLVEGKFNGFGPETARGLCRGMARNSGLWALDAFELMTAVRCTKDMFLKIADSSKRVDFLRTIIAESQSDLYTMNLIRRIEDDLKPDQSEVYEQEQIAKLNLPSPSLSTSAKKKLNLRSDVEKIKTDFAAQLRNHYLAPNALSVFEQFGDLGAGKIEPNVFLLDGELSAATRSLSRRNI